MTVAGATYFGTRQVTAPARSCVDGNGDPFSKLDGNGMTLASCMHAAASRQLSLAPPTSRRQALAALPARCDWLHFGLVPKTEAGPCAANQLTEAPITIPGRRQRWFSRGAWRAWTDKGVRNGLPMGQGKHNEIGSIRPFLDRDPSFPCTRSYAGHQRLSDPQRLQLRGQCASGVMAGPQLWRYLGCKYRHDRCRPRGPLEQARRPRILSSFPLCGLPERPQVAHPPVSL